MRKKVHCASLHRGESYLINWQWNELNLGLQGPHENTLTCTYKIYGFKANVQLGKSELKTVH